MQSLMQLEKFQGATMRKTGKRGDCRAGLLDR